MSGRLLAEREVLGHSITQIEIHLAAIKKEIETISYLEVSISTYIRINSGILQIEENLHKF